jgi:hypothetical protein
VSVWSLVGFVLGVALFFVLLSGISWLIWRLRGKPFGAFPGSTWDGPLMLSNLWVSERELKLRRAIWDEERWLREKRKRPSTYAVKLDEFGRLER